MIAQDAVPVAFAILLGVISLALFAAVVVGVVEKLFEWRGLVREHYLADDLRKNNQWLGNHDERLTKLEKRCDKGLCDD